jgi:hypothetical protein
MKTVTVNYTRPYLYPKQSAAFFNDARISCIEASTKCFPANTLVRTDKGHKPISEIEIGDFVLSWNPLQRIYEYKMVLNCFSHCAVDAPHDMIKLITKYGDIHATRDHEFRIGDKWIGASELAKRAMEANTRNQPILCEQFRKTSFNEALRRRGKVACNEASIRRQRLFKNNAIHQRKVYHNKDAQGRSGHLVGWEEAAQFGASQPLRFQQSEQFNFKLGAYDSKRECEIFGSEGALWEVSRQYKRQFQADRGSSQGNQARVCTESSFAEGVSGKIWRRQKHSNANFNRPELEARCIDYSDILGYELYETNEKVYDLEVAENSNYCITEYDINVHNCGKTLGAIVWIIEEMLNGGGNGKVYWWVAPIYPQAKIAFTRMKRMLPQGAYEVNEAELRITLFNGAVIFFRSADNSDALYGEDVWAVVIDEASRSKDNTWYAVRSTLTKTGGKARMIGNVKGRSNWFYKLCRQAQTGKDPDMQFHSINAQDAVDAGIFPAKELESARRDFKGREDAFDEIYFNIPAADGGNPFGMKNIHRNRIMDISDLPPVCWGWDLARSVDWTVGIALDKNGHVCDFERFQLPWTATKLKIIECTGNTRALIDSTGVGDAIVEDLQRAIPNVEGFKFTSLSKQQLMEGLMAALSQDLIKIPEGDIITELEYFEFKHTATGTRYSAPDGLHDDCVMALALAVKHYRGEYTPNFYIDIL